MVEATEDSGTVTYSAREAVGVFDNVDVLEAAVDELEISGFDRAAISVLASDKKVTDCLGKLYASVTEIEDDPRAPQIAFVSKNSRIEAEAATIGVPLFIGGIAGGLAFVPSGGTIAAGAVGGGIGGLRSARISHRHIDRVRAQLAQGGLVLWVAAGDDASSARGLEILIKTGARDAHLHEIQREWPLKDRPSALGQPNPFLGSEPVAP
jgi:hypothetical protein